MIMGPEAVQTVESFEDHDPADLGARYPTGNSSAACTVANFVNTILGAGIIGLPFALAKVCSILQRAHTVRLSHNKDGTNAVSTRGTQVW